MSVALYSYDKLLNGLNYYNRHNWYNNDDGGGGGGDGDSSGDHEVYVKYVKACYWQLYVSVYRHFCPQHLLVFLLLLLWPQLLSKEIDDADDDINDDNDNRQR